MITIEINNFKEKIPNIQQCVENNYVHSKIELCERRDADIKVIVKDRDVSHKRVQYTDYYKFVKQTTY